MAHACLCLLEVIEFGGPTYTFFKFAICCVINCIYFLNFDNGAHPVLQLILANNATLLLVFNLS